MGMTILELSESFKQIGTALISAIDERVRHQMAEHDFDDACREAIENYDFGDLIEDKAREVIDDYDFSDKFEEAMNDANFEHHIEDALDNVDLSEVVRKAVRDTNVLHDALDDVDLSDQVRKALRTDSIVEDAVNEALENLDLVDELRRALKKVDLDDSYWTDSDFRNSLDAHIEAKAKALADQRIIDLESRIAVLEKAEVGPRLQNLEKLDKLVTFITTLFK